MSDTGVAGLSESQRKALDAWFNKHMREVIHRVVTKEREIVLSRAGTTSADSAKSEIGSHHWADEVCCDGGVVLLEDGSLWSIETTDRVHILVAIDHKHSSQPQSRFN